YKLSAGALGRDWYEAADRALITTVAFGAKRTCTVLVAPRRWPRRDRRGSLILGGWGVFYLIRRRADLRVDEIAATITSTSRAKHTPQQRAGRSHPLVRFSQISPEILKPIWRERRGGQELRYLDGGHLLFLSRIESRQLSKSRQHFEHEEQQRQH